MKELNKTIEKNLEIIYETDDLSGYHPTGGEHSPGQAQPPF